MQKPAQRHDEGLEAERADGREELPIQLAAAHQRFEATRMAPQPLDQLPLAPADVEPAEQMEDAHHHFTAWMAKFQPRTSGTALPSGPSHLRS